MKVIFFGTPRFAANILTYLIEHGIEIAAVVTKPDRPRGRSLHFTPTAVKECIQKLSPQTPLFQPEKASTAEFEVLLKGFQPDLFVVVAYGEIIKQNILDIPKLGCINVHASILPKYRGAAPMQRALMDGVSETGVTIMEMALKMDAGDIIEIAKVPVPQEMICGELEEKLCSAGCESLLRVINSFNKGAVKKFPQNHEEATFAPKITAEEEEIHWAKPANILHNLIRALSPFPGAWCNIMIGNEKKRLKIKRTKVVSKQGSPGEVLLKDKENLIVSCGQDALAILELQMEGKRPMSIKEFLMGVNQPLSFL